MIDQLVTFETARLAKEKEFKITTLDGFDEKGVDLFNKNYFTNWNGRRSEIKDRSFYSRPKQSSLQNWLREVHDIDLIVYPSFMGKIKNYYYVIIKDRNFDNVLQGETNNHSFEDALELGLQEALKII
jgi:hypothetical protein